MYNFSVKNKIKWKTKNSDSTGIMNNLKDKLSTELKELLRLQIKVKIACFHVIPYSTPTSGSFHINQWQS